MKQLKQDLKDGQFKQIYLLCGSESYLKHFYRDKLKAGILADDDGMNFSHFEGKGINVKEVGAISQTLPFFRDRRLVLIEQSGFFKAQSDMPEVIASLPETTYILFVENEIDKRSRLYKAVKEKGYIAELNGMSERELVVWTATLLKRDHKKITEQTIRYFLSQTGTDMERIRTELEKVICYALDREVITDEDIDAVCTPQISGKIFEMVDAIAARQQEKALALYHDLLLLRESPLSILYLLTRHYNILMQVKGFQKEHKSPKEIAPAVGVPPFVVNKYIAGSSKFTHSQLTASVTRCLETEEYIKTGRLQDVIGVELLLIEFSNPS
ncbi:DNA polymerase III subunit delta [Anaerolentibacter hominis]|uniref:DNA polymerase III subunit delta n=1 Tax=Anaerolentibacter hominis TaxID=3079009 RepID=UPI0031B84A0D